MSCASFYSSFRLPIHFEFIFVSNVGVALGRAEARSPSPTGMERTQELGSFQTDQQEAGLEVEELGLERTL